MTNRLIKLGAIIGFLMVSTPAEADPGTVAVLRPYYENFREGVQSEDGAEAVFTMVKHAVKEAGMNVADQEATDAALQKLSGSTAAHCDNQSCLKMISESTGAWNAVAVTVVDKEAHFVLSIKYAVGDKLEAKVFGNRASLLDDIYGNVEKVLSTNAPEEAAISIDSEESSDETGESTDSDQVENQAHTKKDGLKPTAFYVSAALTAALAISWGTVEIVGYSRQKDLEGQPLTDSWSSKRDDLKTLRVVDGILLGTAVAGAITTTILFFLTDFDNENPEPTITTGFLEGGAIMSIKGSF